MKIEYSVAHTIVSEITLLELSGEQKNHHFNVSGKDYFRFNVMGTNSATGLRRQFNLAIVSGLTSTQRGTLDVPYLYSVLDETVEELLTGYGYFITGQLPRGKQIENMIERCVLAPSSCVCTLAGGQKVVFEGRKRVFSIDDIPVDSNEFAERIVDRHYAIMGGKMIYPYMVLDTPRWGEDTIKSVDCTEIYTDEVRAAIVSHYQHSRQLPHDRVFPAVLMQQREGTADRVVETINKPVRPTEMAKHRPRSAGAVNHIASIPSEKQDVTEMVQWQMGLKELDTIMSGGLRRGEMHAHTARRSA